MKKVVIYNPRSKSIVETIPRFLLSIPMTYAKDQVKLRNWIIDYMDNPANIIRVDDKFMRVSDYMVYHRHYDPYAALLDLWEDHINRNK